MAVDEFGREVLAPSPPSRSHPDDHRRSISPSPSSYRRSRRRRRDSEDDRRKPRDDSHDDHRHHHRHGRERSYSRSSHEPRKRKHPSEKYCVEPMLCQYVWEQQLLAARRAEKEQEAAKNDDDDAVAKDEETADNEQPSEEPLYPTPEETSSAYKSYNTKYCLNYVRTFFNSHLDDSWFRLRLSPLAQYSLALTNKERSQFESLEIKKEILHSLEEHALGVIPKKDPDCADYLGMPKCSFVSGCRLGVGSKPTTSKLSHPTRGFGGGYHQHSHQEEFVLSETDRNRIERHAKCHLHSFVKSDAVVKIMDVPPDVCDDQLLIALSKFGDKKDMSLWSGDAHIPTVNEEKEDPLPYHRDVYVSFTNRESKEHLLDKLHRYNEDHLGNHSSSKRRGDNHRMPRILEMEVDCTDVYGRKEMDADGKGSAPPGKKVEGYPPKSCRVNVSTVSLAASQPVCVLSAAVSSRGRIAKDRATVTEIAQMLDEVREITRGNRLVDLLRLLYPTEAEWEGVDDEDVLDVSIAYLRRVHLFSFYNGCVMAKSVGSVLSYGHPVGTIHLRLRNADDILKKMAEDRGEVGGGEAMEVDDADAKIEATVANDMLVMRLNESIEKAFEMVKEMSERGPGCLIDEKTDAAAKEIQAAERGTKSTWLENHGAIDEDGRARCSFHWCKKLFKDKAFLQKHLLKKHSDHLRSECAKCHDQAMMVAWDNDENRPVPPVLIDCGAKFRKVPSAVVGSAEPIAHDPEPQLWKEEEERMAEEERRRKEAEEEERLAEEERQRAEQRRQEAMAGEKRKGNFVDVDDMVEEKVELKMEDVVVAPPAKKKKKKKSLL